MPQHGGSSYCSSALWAALGGTLKYFICKKPSTVSEVSFPNYATSVATSGLMGIQGSTSNEL